MCIRDRIGKDGSDEGFIRSTSALAGSGTGFYLDEDGTSWFGDRGGSYLGISNAGVVTAAGFTFATSYLTSNTSKTTYQDALNDGVFVGTTGIGLGTAKFTVSDAGVLHAESGDISGFSIDSTSISSSNDNLILSSSGEITASNALLKGRLTAETINATGSGIIGGFELGKTVISSSNSNLILSSSGAITASEALLSGKLTASEINATGSGIIGGF